MPREEANPASAFPPHAIAIVGMAGRFPDAQGLEEFWRNIRDGVESLRTFTDADLDAAGVSAAERAHPAYVRRGTVLDGAEQFDAGFFGLSPREAEIIDPQHRVFLECAWEALEDAGYAPRQVKVPVGVYGGASINTYLLNRILRNPALAAAVGGYQLMLGNDKDFLCTRVSYKLDLRGPSMTIQTACSTSLVAIEAACRALKQGECDMALAGGVSVSFPQRAGYLHQEGMILSPDGHCRPFDAAAGGTRAGAGAGIVVLKRLTDALADGDTIHAVIRGAAVNNDGADKAGYTAPSIDGQVEVVATAQAVAAVDPRSITYIEAHGTGTPLGDPIEVAALTEVFRASTSDVGFCRLGSLKANLGHLDVAAGVAGLIKTVLALKHGELPPLVNFRAPNPQLGVEGGPFVLSAEPAAWDSAGPRRAGVSSFGIGGTNAHVVLEEAPVVLAPASGPDERLFVLSAKTGAALDAATANLAAWLEANPEAPLADAEWTLQVGREAFAHRRILAAADAGSAVKALRQPDLAPVFSAVHEGGDRPVAFLFSGQGSQHPAMASGLHRAEPVFRGAVDRCARLLEPHLGLDIRDLIFGETPGGILSETRFTQPALFVVEYALAQLWKSWGVQPQAMLGHSIGEYVAAHLAGVMSLEDALAIVAARGRLMQAAPVGAMAAVPLAAAELAPLLAPGVEIAAVNAPGLCAISGPHEAVDEVLRRLKERGVEGRALHTSHAFHSAMMEPALAPFKAVFEGIALSPPAIPYVSNLTGTWITAEQAVSPAYYADHLRHAVQFERGVRTLAEDPDLFLLEIGPSDALTALARATVGRERSAHVSACLPHPRHQRSDLLSMREAAGRLWLAGVELRWAGLHTGSPRRRISLPTYPFERRPYLVEPASQGQRAETVQTAGPYVYAPTWMRDDSFIGPAPRLDGAWLALGADGPFLDAVADRLQANGAEAIRVAVGPSDDISALVREFGAGKPIRGAVWLDDTGARGDLSAYDALTALALGLDTRSPVRIVAASTGAQSVMDEQVARPEAALAFGPVLVLPTEIEGLEMRSVDLDARYRPDEAAEVLVREAASTGGPSFVAHRGGRRWVRRLDPVDLAAARSLEPPLRQRGVYLITGGLGGIGLQLALWLAKTVAARLVLIGRRALPPREAWDGALAEGGDAWSAGVIQAIREIEGAGGEVLVVAADAADQDAMAAAVAGARERWGEVNGVVHAAGVSGNGAIALRKTPEDVRAVLSPKVDGLRALTAVLGDSPLDFVVLTSSINAVFGAPGLIDYAAANAVLDAFVESAARPAVWRHVQAIDWGPWCDVGMAARLAAAQGRSGDADFVLTAIAPAAGVEVFARVFASGRSRVVVSAVDLSGLIRSGEASGANGRGVGAVQATASPSVAIKERPQLSTPFEAPVSETEQRLAAIWTELIGVDNLSVHDDFFELGGHSLLATRVLAQISGAFSVHLALRDVFDAPTIRGLAERIDAAAEPDAAETPPDDREEFLI